MNVGEPIIWVLFGTTMFLATLLGVLLYRTHRLEGAVAYCQDQLDRHEVILVETRKDLIEVASDTKAVAYRIGDALAVAYVAPEQEPEDDSDESSMFR